MRFHVVSLPHTQTTQAYSPCAYTEKVRKFCNMMTDLGHEVFLYASEDNKARCAELITCITKSQQKSFGFSGPEDYLKIDFNSEQPWKDFNKKIIAGIKKRIQPKDFVCLITSEPMRPIMDAFPDHQVVEFGIGYPRTVANYRVFESYAWQNYVYGRQGSDGFNYDAVIPNYFETENFPFSKKKDDYFLFIGRLTGKKGYMTAVEVCKRLDKRLILAGQGDPPDYGEYVGVVGPEERARLMSRAQAVFVPTEYVGPFEGVHVEALLCGTPVITTDFGVFSETVVNGVNGFRCRSLREFLDAAKEVQNWSMSKRYVIRVNAQRRFSTNIVALDYEAYFERLLTLWGDGWYQL